MKYTKLMVISLLLSMLVATFIPLVVIPSVSADEAVSSEATTQDDVEVLSQNDTSIAITMPKLSFSNALNIAYTIRNMTYELFTWEMSYNITAANKTLSLGDTFLSKAIEINATGNVKRAIAFAMVAATHYSHAPAFANAVLARVVCANLVNDTITSETVIAVINTANELEQILMNAVNYAVSGNYNVSTRVSLLIERGHEVIANASELLNQGDITEAFAYSVKGYKLYVKAYSLLVKEVYAQAIKITVSANVTGTLIKQIKKPSIPPGLVDKLPEEIRTTIRERLENATGKGLGEIIGKVRKEIEARIEERSRKEMEIAASILEKIMEKTLNKTTIREIAKGKALREFCKEIVIEIKSKTNSTGLELLQNSLNELREKLRSRDIEIQVNITSKGIGARGGKSK